MPTAFTMGSGFLKSSLLPANIEISFGFRQDSTFDSGYNTYESALADVYKKGNFLFNYLKLHPNYMARFFPFRFGIKDFDKVKAVYPDIAKYDYKQIDWLYILDDYYRKPGNMISSWLLLPNGTTILIGYNSELRDKETMFFAGFTGKKYESRHKVCIVFDKTGRIIAGDDSMIKIEVGPQ